MKYYRELKSREVNGFLALVWQVCIQNEVVRMTVCQHEDGGDAIRCVTHRNAGGTACLALSKVIWCEKNSAIQSVKIH